MRDYTKHIGERFGRLVIVERVEGKRPRYLCKCDCGNSICVDYGDLTRKYGGTKSCGCYRKEKVTKHGGRYSRIYSIYRGMITRTTNANSQEFEDYGGRGITICDEWLGEQGFETFQYWALNNGYADNLTIDRIDNDKGYSPDNCRWSDRKTQNNNKSNTIYLTYNNETKSLAEWAEEIGIDRVTLYDRIYIYGWSVDKALSTQVRGNKANVSISKKLF